MRVGAYEVLSEIGRGGGGCVLRARARDGSEVALKLLHRRKEGDAALARFERETRLLAAMGETDGFVPVLDAGEAPEGAFLVMPLLTGGTLRDRLRGPLGIDETISLGLALARALGRAHAKGIVHRDVKPENVIFTGDGRPLVAALGLAKHFVREGPSAPLSVSLSRAGEIRGTFGYASPEQLRDAKSVGPTSDVFSLGSILYECLA
ncbi:serine/threonine protein kinase, partial [bacterium]|nr:serine/threonine protein kinase [bacterium]